MKTLYCWISALLLVNTLGCATSGRDDSNLTVSELASKGGRAAVTFTKFAGVVDFSYKDAPFKAEWIGCKPKEEKGTVIAMHRDRAGYDPLQFCNGWISQTFLTNGYTVVTVNRPGFGSSNGRADFAGPKSVAAIVAGVQAAMKSMAPKQPPTGIWGYSSGATAALFSSRAIKGLQWAIVGGGVYDLEDTLAKSEDSYIKREIEDVKSLEGSKGLEDRSISYDVSGLPKRIVVYHGKDDKAVPVAQATSFEETLNTNEYTATIQTIEGINHDIPATTHGQVLDVLLNSLSK